MKLINIKICEKYRFMLKNKAAFMFILTEIKTTLFSLINCKINVDVLIKLLTQQLKLVVLTLQIQHLFDVDEVNQP